jgi:ureidoglycolate hydrolase
VPDRSRLISAVRLNAPSWEPFGWVPVEDTDPSDGVQGLSFEWGDPHVNLISHSLNEVHSTAEGLRCEVMFRHRTHTQVLMPLDHRCVLAVAAPSMDFADPDADESVHAFILDPLQAVVLHRGTWHWGPFPTATPRVQLFNVQGRRYSEDNESVDLADRGLVITAVLG